MRSAFSTALLASVALLAACQSRLEPPATVQDAESEIRARSHALVGSEQRRELETILSFFAEDAVFQIEGPPTIRGRPGIREAYEELFRMPVVSFGSTIDRIVTSRSGDMAYETGINEMVMDQGGERITTRGKYLGVWRREADGEWRIAAVAITNDVPR